MTQNILRKLMLIAVLLTGSHAFAHDFEAQNSDGVTIYYNITSATDLTVEVTSGDNTYSGAVAIPASVTYNNRTLKVTRIGSGAFFLCKGLTSVTIPNSIISIGGSAFKDCRNLTSVTIPNSVTSIGDYAFCGCSGLTSVDIPNSVTIICDFAFRECSSLTSVAISNSVTSIGYQVFEYCRSLTSVTIPNSVTSIGDYAFCGCSSLTNVTIPNSVTSIGGSAFSSCSSLTSVTIPNSVTSIGRYAFSDCTGLTSVIIPNTVTSISDNAFSSCSGLTTLTIGSGVNKIQSDAFRGCTSLSVINSLSINPSTTSAFETKTQMETTLRIPKGSLASYQATDGWKEFLNIVEVENLEDKLNGTVITYNVNANYDSAQGSMSINGTIGTFVSVNADSEIEFVITPNAGYTIDKVTLNGTDVTADVVDNKYTVAKATEDITFAVTFKKQTFALVLKCSEAGAFKRILNYGETATYEIVASEMWEINTVTFNGEDVTTELVDNVFTTPEITEDSELSVVFVDIATSVYSVYNTSDVKVYASQQTISIKGLEDNTPVAVYNPNGQMEYSKVATDYEMNINMNKNGVYLVKVGERTFKVVL